MKSYYLVYKNYLCMVPKPLQFWYFGTQNPRRPPPHSRTLRYHSCWHLDTKMARDHENQLLAIKTLRFQKTPQATVYHNPYFYMLLVSLSLLFSSACWCSAFTQVLVEIKKKANACADVIRTMDIRCCLPSFLALTLHTPLKTLTHQGLHSKDANTFRHHCWTRAA